MMQVPMPSFGEKPSTGSARTHPRPLRDVLVITPTGWAVTRTDYPTISVLIPVLNEARYLPHCLDSIFTQNYPPDLVEVLVIDGGSTDNTREIVASYRHRYPNLRLLINPSGGIAAALNLGIQAASGEIIVRVDGHTVLAPEYLRRCVIALEVYGADAVGGVYQPIGVSSWGEVIATVMAHPLGGGPAIFRQSRRRRWADTVYLGAWRKDTLLHLGGFNECLEANEDYELFYRLRRQGGRVLFDPKIRSWTVTRNSLRALWRQYVRYGFWKAQMLRQHPRALRLRQLPAPSLVAGFWILLFLGWRIAWAPLVALGLLVAYAVGAAAVAGEIALQVGWKHWWRAWVALWVMHWGWGMGFWHGLFARPKRRKNT